jgi:hypothetical protein
MLELKTRREVESESQFDTCQNKQMTNRDFHEAYGESVYKVRLRIAMSLLPIEGVSQAQALEEADKFIELLLTEDMRGLREKFE